MSRCLGHQCRFESGGWGEGCSDGNSEHFGSVVVRGVGGRESDADSDDFSHRPRDSWVCGGGEDNGCGDFGGGCRELDSKLRWGVAHAAICVDVR